MLELVGSAISATDAALHQGFSAILMDTLAASAGLNEHSIRVAWPDKSGYDDHGRVAYHGTTDLHQAKIEKEGLRGDVHKTSAISGNNVSVTDNREVAAAYAKDRAEVLGGKPIVVEVRIPKDVVGHQHNYLGVGKHTTYHVPAAKVHSIRGAWFDPHTGIDDHGRGPGHDRARVARAKASHVPMSKAKLAEATTREAAVAQAIGGEHIGGNKALDVVVKENGRITHAIEVKSVFGKHDKVTMHPRSRVRKEKAAAKAGAEAHTIAIDARGSKDVYYHRAGFGSYRFHSMTKATSIKHLHSLIRGKK